MCSRSSRAEGLTTDTAVVNLCPSSSAALTSPNSAASPCKDMSDTHYGTRPAKQPSTILSLHYLCNQYLQLCETPSDSNHNARLVCHSSLLVKLECNKGATTGTLRMSPWILEAADAVINNTYHKAALPQHAKGDTTTLQLDLTLHQEEKVGALQYKVKTPQAAPARFSDTPWPARGAQHSPGDRMPTHL